MIVLTKIIKSNCDNKNIIAIIIKKVYVGNHSRGGIYKNTDIEQP